jgi:hypothetical protein
VVDEEVVEDEKEAIERALQRILKKKKKDCNAFRMALIPCKKCEFRIFLPIN